MQQLYLINNGKKNFQSFNLVAYCLLILENGDKFFFMLNYHCLLGNGYYSPVNQSTAY